MDERLNDARALARDLAEKGTAFQFRILMGATGQYKVITDPYSIRLSVHETADEALEERARLVREGLKWPDTSDGTKS